MGSFSKTSLGLLKSLQKDLGMEFNNFLHLTEDKVFLLLLFLKMVVVTDKRLKLMVEEGRLHLKDMTDFFNLVIFVKVLYYKIKGGE